MNESYTYLNGQAIIANEVGEQRHCEYYDNLEKVLVQENLIETISEKIKHLESVIPLYQKYKIKQAIESELTFLKKQLQEEEKQLQTLQKIKSKEKESKELKIVEVADEKPLEMLSNYLNFYGDLGFNYKKYRRYYKQGQLYEKLNEKYNASGIQLAKEYLLTKQPSLIKKKIKK